MIAVHTTVPSDSSSRSKSTQVFGPQWVRRMKSPATNSSSCASGSPSSPCRMRTAMCMRSTVSGSAGCRAMSVMPRSAARSNESTRSRFTDCARSTVRAVASSAILRRGEEEVVTKPAKERLQRGIAGRTRDRQEQGVRTHESLQLVAGRSEGGPEADRRTVALEDDALAAVREAVGVLVRRRPRP